MKTFSLPVNWRPRDYQNDLWYYLRDGGKRAVACWHRRSGKDEVCLHATAAAGMERAGNYWHMLPEYSQARKAIWDAVNPHTGLRRVDEAFPQEIRRFTREHEMMIGLVNGSTWQVVGSDNYNSLMGTTPAGMVLSEYALSNPSAWGYLSPILEENNGWASFISTPRGRNHFDGICRTAQREQGWHYSLRTNEHTGVFTQAQLDSKLRELCDIHPAQYARSLWMQEYFCSFDAAIPGSIWGDCIERAKEEGRIADFDIDTSHPVYTGWDLGRTDDTAIWFYQFNGTKIDVIDHFASPMLDINNAESPDTSLVHILRAKARQGGFRYARHWLPHDARPRTLAAGGKSILQQFHDARDKHPDLGDFAIVKRLDRQEGIMAARATFPHVRFHKTNCERGLLSLAHYHREWDDEKKVFTDQPQHDWCLNGETDVLTRYGTCRIMDLPKTGEVLTSCGWKRYQNPRVTRRNAPLVEVGFSDGLTVKCTPDHPFLTDNGWKFASDLQSDSLIQSSLTLSHSISMVAFTAFGRARDTLLAAANRCIAQFGWPLLVPSLQTATFTTRTTNQKITALGISNACQQKNTWQNRNPKAKSARVQGTPPPHGMHQMKDDCGIAVKPSGHKAGRSGSELKNLANGAAGLFSALKEKLVRISVFARRHAKWLRIESVKKLDELSDVWCITVPGIEEFSLSNGAIVHNSSHDADAWRSVSLSWKYPKAPQGPEASPVDKLKKESVNAMAFGAMKKKHLSKMAAQRAERMN